MDKDFAALGLAGTGALAATALSGRSKVGAAVAGGALLAGAAVVYFSKDAAAKPKSALKTSLSLAENVYTKPSTIEHQMNLTYGLYNDTKQTAFQQQMSLAQSASQFTLKPEPDRPSIVEMRFVRPEVKVFAMAGTSDPPGWLGGLIALGTRARSVSFQWLRWKRHYNPWIQRMHTGGNDQTTMNNWGHLLTEPPPPVQGAWTGERARQSWLNRDVRFPVPKSEYFWRKHAPVPPMSPEQEVAYRRTMAWMGGASIKDSPSPNWNLTWQNAYPRMMVLDCITKDPRYTDSFLKTWSLDKHPVLTGKRSSLNLGNRVKIPAWWPDRTLDGKWAYWERVKQYYHTCYWLVWAGVIYAIEAGKLIPDWYKVHCAEHGVLCPSYEVEMERRKFYLTDRWGDRLMPISVDGKRAGVLVNDADVAKMLRLIVKHTPVPGSLPSGTEILPDPMRRIPDWPTSQTGLFKPDFSFPTGVRSDGSIEWTWHDLITQRLREQSDSSNMGQAGKIIAKIGMAIGTSIVSIAAGGMASAAVSYVEGVMGKLSEIAITGVLDAALRNAMLWCIDAATVIVQGGTIGTNDFWRLLVSIGTGAAREIVGTGLNEAVAACQRSIQGIELPAISGGAGWEHAQALIGNIQTTGGLIGDDFLDQFGGGSDGSVQALVEKYSR